MKGNTFYLGTHIPIWLEWLDIKLFVSHNRLRKRARLPIANGPWALDSGAFTSVTTHGRFEESPKEYARYVRRYADHIGHMQFAAIQDWMCETPALQRTGLTVQNHQILTARNYVDLMAIDDSLKWLPTVQGQTLEQYLEHEEIYRRLGVDLRTCQLVGLGSVCRRQATAEIGAIVAGLSHLKLHGFGVKTSGLNMYGHLLTSCDSMAWSYEARYSDPIPGHERLHKNCANCAPYAYWWRNKIVARLGA